MIDEKRLIEEIDGKVAGLTNIQMMQIADIIASQQEVGECDRDCKDCWKTKLVNIVKPKEHADGWIPCSERLPNCNGCYLAWRPHFFGGEIGMSAICYFDGQNTWHDSYGVDFTRILNEKDVIAWMPLPEAYKGE